MWCGLTLPTHMGPSPTNSSIYALDYFYIPVCIHTLVAKYFQDLKMCCSRQDFTPDWQQLEVGIVM